LGEEKQKSYPSKLSRNHICWLVERRFWISSSISLHRQPEIVRGWVLGSDSQKWTLEEETAPHAMPSGLRKVKIVNLRCSVVGVIQIR